MTAFDKAEINARDFGMFLDRIDEAIGDAVMKHGFAKGKAIQLGSSCGHDTSIVFTCFAGQFSVAREDWQMCIWLTAS
jgi:hypothetical protein